MLDILLEVVPIQIKDKNLMLTESEVIKKLYNFVLFSLLLFFRSCLNFMQHIDFVQTCTFALRVVSVYFQCYCFASFVIVTVENLTERTDTMCALYLIAIFYVIISSDSQISITVIKTFVYSVFWEERHYINRAVFFSLKAQEVHLLNVKEFLLFERRQFFSILSDSFYSSYWLLANFDSFLFDFLFLLL